MNNRPPVIARPVAILCLALLLGAPGVSYSADATVTWNPPTQYEDNTPIPATGDGALAKYTISFGNCNTGKTGITGTVTKVDVPAPAAQAQITGIAMGTTVCVFVNAFTNNGIGSANSNVANKAFPFPVPKPPTNVAITAVGGVAYEMRRQPDGEFALRVVGTVRPGAQCYGLAPQYGFDLFEVDRADVDLERGVRKDSMIVTACTAG